MKTPTLCEHWVFVNEAICDKCFEKATAEFRQSLESLKRLLEKCGKSKGGAVYGANELFRS